MHKILIKENEFKIFKTLCSLLHNNVTLFDKVDINPYQIAKKTGVSYNTVRNVIKKNKDL